MSKKEAAKAGVVYSISTLGKVRMQFHEKLPFRHGSAAWKKRMKEAMKSSSESAKVINCFGTEKFEVLGRQLIVKIFNDKVERWEEHIGVEYHDVCAICGTFMLVRAIKGTSWLALCSQKCYEKYKELWNKTAEIQLEKEQSE